MTPSHDRLPGTTARRRVLLVEDELELGRVVLRHVEDAGYEVEHVTSGEAALRILAERPADLVLLDLMLPGIDGLEVCRRLRAHRDSTLVLMLTARSTEPEKVLGLETGADDYLAKPFGLQELVARVRALFRRVDALTAGEENDGPVRADGDLRVDPRAREVWIRGQPVPLTRKEFDLLWHFVRNPGRVYSRAQLLDAVWGYTQESDEHAVNCHINRLRAKIEAVPSEPTLLVTVWGIGYKFAGRTHP
jgi:DNA-binding response OmpR family regulator